ncbi:hypothetical protein J8J14_19620 [Roseomonas sp. SSH11]|uniref:Uncharacterized protein n=1 Tax=Pararoseomonas baculiformis TaxID=2820812 RepID=A0ABS4AJ05_9PROT|nr:hypothetical protein [Pararoseomonas baculiformis]MBP0446990.1 hypothetical protein [Pararoseomonas baculiformis]
MSEDGEAWLGLVTPSSRGVREEELSLAWLVSRQPDGLVLTRMPSARPAGVFATIGAALAAVEFEEKRPPGLAYRRS